MSFNLPVYNNQKEKKDFFSVQIIDTDCQLYDFMSSLPSLFNNKQGIWRGMSESKYKLYNSLQRKNLELKKLNSIEDVIKTIVESTNLLENWNKGLIKKYFSNYGIYRFPIQKIDDDEKEWINHYTKFNYNILAQKGLFILNVDPYLPLEESIIQRIKYLSKPKPIIELRDALIRNKQNFVCFDIHKRFIPKIVKALSSQSVNIIEDAMFPNLRKLKDEIFFEIYNKNN